MPNIPSGYAQLNYVLSLLGDSQEMICTMGVRFDAITFDDVPGIMELAYSAFASEFDNHLPLVYTIQRLESYSNFGGENMAYTTTGAPAPGLATDPAVPQNCAYLLKKITATPGVTGRGRMYLPGVTESQVDTVGNVLATKVAALNVSCANFLSGLTAIDGIAAPSLLHAQVGDIPSDIIAMNCDQRIATQRRRLR